MSKKNNGKLLNYSFLILILTIGFPFWSLDIPTGVSATSDYQIINFFLGKDMVGKSIFDFNNQAYAQTTDAIYQSIDDVYDPLDDVIMGRTESSETKQTGERVFTTSTGLTRWIQDNQGEYVERLINEDSNGVGFESGTFTYWYDKTACGMTVYDVGRMTANSKELIKYNGWVAKSALNGTDNWIDLPQNSLPCVVTVVDNSDGTVITAVREDSNGKFTETYDIPKPLKDLKTTLTFFNNDTALNDHKIAFTNILDATPEHYRFLLKLTEIADVDPLDMNDPIEIPYFKGYTTSPATVPMQYSNNCNIPVNSTLNDRYDDCTTFIGNGNFTDISRDDFHISMYVNATLNGSPTIMTDNGFAMDYFSDEYQTWIPIRYEFTNDAIDKLWNVRIVNNQPLQNRIFIDYMNISNITSVGQTATLDPSITSSLSEVDIHKVTDSSGTFFGSGTRCTNTPSLAFGTDFAWSTSYIGGMIGGRFTVCTVPMLTFDLTVIPDEASILQMDFSYNVTSTAMSNDGQMRARWIAGFAEDVRTFSGTDAGLTIFRDFVGGTTTAVNTFGGVFDMPTFPTSAGTTPCAINPVTIANPCIISITLVDPSTLTDNIETQIESGQDFMILSGCNDNTFDETKTAQGRCDHGDVTAQSFSTSWTGDESTILLDITWEIFLPSTAPQNLTCVATSPTDLFLDWNPPLDSGGTPLTGYQIDRSTGASFQPLATVGVSPSSFTDTTAFAGVVFAYRVSAINDVGTGAFAEISCGIAGLSDDPFLQTLTNIGVGIVAVDWLAPVFTGNDPITGYKIERTTGTPVGITNDWEWVIHKTSGAFPPTNHVIFHNDENIVMSTPSLNDIHGEGILFKSIDILDVEARTLGVLSTYANTNPNLSYQIKVFDGTYSSAGVNTAGSDFPLNSAIALKGAGLLQSFITTSSFAETTQGFVIDTSGATFDGTVTIMIINSDANDQFNSGTTSINSIDIEGYATWDFGDLVIEVGVPVKSVKSVDTFFIVDPIGNEQSGQITNQSPNGIIFGDGFITLVADTGDTNTEFIDNTVTESTNFGYRVSAINAQGTSDPSNVLAILTAGAPSAPVITATATGTTTINIDWSTPDLNEGILVEYEIERKLGTGGIFGSLATTTDTEFDDGTGLFILQSATEYCYQIKTITNVGESAFSTESCATTFDAPSEVENLLVIAIDGSSVNMSFDDPLNDGGSPITGFQIEQKIGAGAFSVVQLSDSLNKIRNDTGLPIGTLITYQVTPFNQFGAGDILSASDTTDATPQAPQNFSCSASSATSITLNWDTPQTFSPPTGYQIDRRTVGGGFSTLVADTADTATQFVDQALAVDSTFQYRILGHTTEGDTDFTPTITCTTLGAPDFPPEDLQGDFTQTVPHQMVLAWDIPDTFGIPIIEFRIERDDGAGYNEIASVSGNTFLFIDQDPANNIVQKYRIITVGTEGDSAPSIAIPFSANQTSHWHYENTVDDTGDNKNVGAVTGTANFNNTGQVGLGMLFDGSTYITVADESDYDHSNNVSFGITTYYRGNSTGVDQVLVSKAGTMSDIGFRMFIDSTGVLGVRLTNTATSNELHVLGSTNVTNNSIHFLGFGYDGNDDESGLSLMVDGSFETKNVITNTLSSGILNAKPLVLGANDGGGNKLTGLLDETRFFGSGTLDDATLQAIAEDSITTVIPINGTISIAGSTFADISRETPLIIMTSGYPLPTIGTINLQNFTATTVNTQAVGLVIDGVSGQFILDPSLFNIMGSLSNYTVITSLTNSEETFPLLSNFDIQVPVFTFTGDFFFQQQRNLTFDILSFNYTQTVIPFDLDCNFKSTLFENGTTVEFDDVFFVQLLQPVSVLEDVVVACIDPNQPIVDPSAPSFGGINTILSFVSFGDTTGVGNFLQFTNNYGDFFGVGLPFLFVIILAAAFTGRSAPTGILIIAIAIGIMWAMGILVIDPFMWGIILVLVILGLLGGKKFL